MPTQRESQGDSRGAYETDYRLPQTPAVTAPLEPILSGVKQQMSYILNAVAALKKYRFLISQMVARDFKTKYKRSVLGVFWSFLNPLLTMSVYYFIFSTLFKSDVKNFAVYLMLGIVSFNFFNEACGMTLRAIVDNASLITKVYVPKYIYPLARIVSSAVNLLISLAPLIIIAALTGLEFHLSAFLSVYFLICLVIFSMGMSLMLSALMVFFRDIQFLWGILSMIWMQASAIFYPESILPDRFRIVLQINPLYHFIKNIRICVLDGVSPDPLNYLICLGIALFMLFIGACVFKKLQDRFVLYL